MDINDAFPSKYLKAKDLKGRDVNVQIGGVVMEDVGGDQCPVLHFHGTEKTLVLNRTNSTSIINIVGTSDTDAWPGHWITLFPTQTDFGAKGQVPCIRVRLEAPQIGNGTPQGQAEQRGEVPQSVPQSPPIEKPAGDDSIPF